MFDVHCPIMMLLPCSWFLERWMLSFRVTYSKTLVHGWIDLDTLMIYFVMDRSCLVHCLGKSSLDGSCSKIITCIDAGRFVI